MKFKEILPHLLLLLGYLLLALATYFAPSHAEERRYELAHPRAQVHRPIVPTLTH